MALASGRLARRHRRSDRDRSAFRAHSPHPARRHGIRDGRRRLGSVARSAPARPADARSACARSAGVAVSRATDGASGRRRGSRHSPGCQPGCRAPSAHEGLSRNRRDLGRRSDLHLDVRPAERPDGHSRSALRSGHRQHGALAANQRPGHRHGFPQMGLGKDRSPGCRRRLAETDRPGGQARGQVLAGGLSGRASGEA